MNKKYDEALICIDEAIEFNPELAVLYNTRGECLLKMKNYDDAIDAFRKANTIEPENEDFSNNLKLAESKKNSNSNGGFKSFWQEILSFYN
jgi:tetratricopeptide (TPR) repeat protein